MHPARLILSTAAAAVPGPDARVGLPKKDAGGARAPSGLPSGVLVSGVLVVPAAAATATTAAASAARGRDEHDAPLFFGGQCRPLVMLAGHGRKGRTALEAQCVDARGQWWQTSLNLNRCIGARDGALVYQESCVISSPSPPPSRLPSLLGVCADGARRAPNGDFDSLCWPCIVAAARQPGQPDGAAALRLECTCLDHLGSPKLATLQLGPQGESGPLPSSTAGWPDPVPRLADQAHAVRPSDGRLVCGEHQGDGTLMF